MKLTQDSLTDWIQLAFTILAGLYALLLLRQSNKEKRRKYIADILDRFYNDYEMRTIIYAIDGGRNINEIRFGGQLEQQADKIIKYLDYIGYLLKEGSLKIKDIKPFHYEINRILNNNAVKKYIEWLLTIGVTLENLNYLLIESSKTSNRLSRNVKH